MAAKGGLGKGLGSLLGDAVPDFLDEGGPVRELSIELIDNDPSQPRKDFDPEKLEELAQSIRVHGIMQPLLVSPTGSDRYRIIAGERRFRAAKMANLKIVPVYVRELDDKEALELALVENLQREDLNPIEEAYGLRRLADEYNLTQEEIGQRVGKSRTAITNLLRLLTLPEEVIQLVTQDRITAGHARALLPLLQPEEMIRVANMVTEKGMSVRQTEEIVGELLETAAQELPDEEPKKAPKKVRGMFREAQERLSQLLDTKVRISGDGTKGRVSIEYYSPEQLQAIYAVLERDKKPEEPPAAQEA